MATPGRSVAATVTALVFALAPAVPAAADERPPGLDELNESIRDYAEGQLDEHAHTVDGALIALERVETELTKATETAEAAREAADKAGVEARAAARAVEQMRRDQLRAARELGALTGRIGELRDEIAAVAREAHRSRGAMLGRGTLHAGNNTVRELTARRAELDDTRELMRHLRTEHRRLTAAADEALARAEAAEAAAVETEERLDELQARHAEALAEAEAARDDERQRYEEFLAESEELEEWLAEYGLDEAIEGTGTFARPGTGRVTSPFGPRLHPILGYVRQHTGIDLGIGDGFIYAADHGVVVEATWNGGYGYMVVIDHGVIDGRQVSTLYAHQPGLSVDIGMPVAKGQPIGSVGSTGLSTGPHVHFEVRVGGAPVDPWPWIRSAPMPDSME